MSTIRDEYCDKFVIYSKKKVSKFPNRFCIGFQSGKSIKYQNSESK